MSIGRLPSPRPNAGLTEPLFSRRGSFFANPFATIEREDPAQRTRRQRMLVFVGTGLAANADGSTPSNQDPGERCSLSAMRAKSGKEEAFIFRMTWPR